jgi:hypothetical protein
MSKTKNKKQKIIAPHQLQKKKKMFFFPKISSKDNNKTTTKQKKNGFQICFNFPPPFFLFLENKFQKQTARNLIAFFLVGKGKKNLTNLTISNNNRERKRKWVGARWCKTFFIM